MTNEITDYEFFINHKQLLVKDGLYSIKQFLKDGCGGSFIDSEKKRVVELMRCKSLEELMVVQRNHLYSNNHTNLNKTGINQIKQTNSKSRMISLLRLKLSQKQQ